MASKVRDFISDNRDQINLIVIKVSGTILTAIAVIGYLDSVSKFDLLVKIHNILVAVMLLMITLTGYSVYVYTMMTDIAGDATLLNYLYMILAITNKVRTSFLFYWVVHETLYPKQNDFYKVIGIDCTIFISISVVWTVSSIACTTLLKKKSPESYMDLSQKNPKVVMIIFGTNLIFTIIVFFSAFQAQDFEKRREHVQKRMVPIALAAFCILFKVNEDEYGIVRRVRMSLGKMLEMMSRKGNNSVTPAPQDDGGEARVENRTDIEIIEDFSQVHVLLGHLNLLTWLLRL